MGTQIRYFRSQKYTVEQEMSEEEALREGTYVRTVFDNNQPYRAEIFNRGELKELIYYGRDPRDTDFVCRLIKEQGPIPVTIYGSPAPTAQGELQTLSGWNPLGELFHITTRLVDDRGEPLREEVFDASGALLGIRTFEYRQRALTRIIFTRADGAEIVELEDNCYLE